MSDYVPTPEQLERWASRRQEVKLARGEYVIRAKDAARFAQQEERFELAETIERASLHSPSTVEVLRLKDAEYYAEAILAAGYRKSEEAFSDESIERAAKAIHDSGSTYKTWDSRDDAVRELYREDVRIVVAALKGDA